MAGTDLFLSGMVHRDNCRNHTEKEICKPGIFFRTVLFYIRNSSIDHDHFSGRSGKSAVFPVSRMHDNCYDDRMVCQ